MERPAREAVQKMAAGEADIAISFISEIKPIKGAKVAGAASCRRPEPVHLFRRRRREQRQSGSSRGRC